MFSVTKIENLEWQFGDIIYELMAERVKDFPDGGHQAQRSWGRQPITACMNFSNFFLRTTRSVISVHILVQVSMRKYILNYK